MYKTFGLIPLLVCSSVMAEERITHYQTYANNVSIGDSIYKVRASLGKPHRTYEIQNAYGGVAEYDYVWDSNDGEWTFVVRMDGTIADIWQASNI